MLATLTGSFGTVLTDLELSMGLDYLLLARGPQIAPPQIVITAMDEASEAQLGVGQDLTRWRGFHANLIRQLQKQGAALIIFDLQFIRPHPLDDQALAAAMRAAGNVLTAECVQKFRHGDQDFFGREECSDSNSRPAISRDGGADQDISEDLVAMRKISPTPMIADAALDHAPFYLINDAENTSVREVWTFFDALAETPSLPVLAWFHTLQQAGTLTATEQPLSNWLIQQRRSCFANPTPTGQTVIDNILCKGDSRYLNYYGPPRTLRMESYADVYEGKVGNLQGKVVFVGRANRQFSPGKTDFFQTPFSDSRTGKMAGVEIMATQYANLLEDRFVEIPVPGWLVSCAFGFFIALILVRFAGWPGILASIAIATVYVGLAFWLFEQRRWWLPLASPLLILPLSWLLSLGWSVYDLLRERIRILDFVKRVFPQWMGMLPAAPGQWTETSNLVAAKSQRDVSGLCLATDIADYTSIAAQHTPREMWALLNAYYHVLGHPVSVHDGIIADVTGDAMMAVWFELPTISQRRSACLAALEMAKAVETFNQSSGLEPLATRIGLHEGDLTLGSLETGNTSHYRAIGDTVNTASRIQGVNKVLGTRILATACILEGLNEILFRPVGTFLVLGRSVPVDLVEVVGQIADAGTGHHAMHKRFAEGLSAFKEGQWENAAKSFAAALQLDSNDGPSRFYLEKSRQYQNSPPLEHFAVVVLDSK